MQSARHTSLERQFAAALPAPRPRWQHRMLWWLLRHALVLRPVQWLVKKWYGT